jgi:hypothetical protein
MRGGAGLEEVRGFIAAPPAWLRGLAASSTEPFPGPAAAETAAIAPAAELQAGHRRVPGSQHRHGTGPARVGTIGVLELAAELGLIDLRGAFERVK